MNKLHVDSSISPLEDGAWEIGVKVHGALRGKKLTLVVTGAEDFKTDAGETAQVSLMRAVKQWAIEQSEQQIRDLLSEE